MPAQRPVSRNGSEAPRPLLLLAEGAQDVVSTSVVARLVSAVDVLVGVRVTCARSPIVRLAHVEGDSDDLAARLTAQVQPAAFGQHGHH